MEGQTYEAKAQLIVAIQSKFKDRVPWHKCMSETTPFLTEARRTRRNIREPSEDRYLESRDDAAVSDGRKHRDSGKVPGRRKDGDCIEPSQRTVRREVSVSFAPHIRSPWQYES
jgi:hypothetical protein